MSRDIKRYDGKSANADDDSARPGEVHLRRALGLPLLVLYGLGVTIGAGIYVLVGAAVGRAGLYAPLSFIMAGAAMAFSACSFAELSGRYPVSAGEAAYVRTGFNSRSLGLVTGLLVVASAIVSSAAIAIGSAGYLQQFLAIPQTVIVVCVVVLLGGIAAWGIRQSVILAGAVTVLEIAGLLVIIAAGFISQPDMITRLPEIVPPSVNLDDISIIISAGLLAFFAFIGFEDLVNLAEEARDPVHDMSRAILWTLVGATLIYVLVVFVAEMSVPGDELAASGAPLSLVFERTTGLSPAPVTAIAILATLNGIIVQIIMASRVLYGLAEQQSLPAVIGRVNPVTQTPLVATGIIIALVLSLALFFPIEQLAELTSRVVLTIFALVNLALFRLKWSGELGPAPGYTAPTWVPPVGFLVCVFFLVAGSLN